MYVMMHSFIVPDMQDEDEQEEMEAEEQVQSMAVVLHEVC